MGTPKPLLPVDFGAEFLPLVQRMVRVLRGGGAGTVFVVVAPDEAGEAIAAQANQEPGAQVVVNPVPERGMCSSVQVGLRAALESSEPCPDAFLVTPCDLPRLTAETVSAVCEAWQQAGDGSGDQCVIIAPVSGEKDKRGHPTLFGTGFADEIFSLDPEKFGLNEILRRHSGRIREVPVSDENALRDADTPDEWRELTTKNGGGTDKQAMQAKNNRGDDDSDAFADAFTDDVEGILRRQDEAMALLERLRAEEPYGTHAVEPESGGGRRDFRRWPTPDGVTLEIHDGTAWHETACTDVGVGGGRIEKAPAWLEGPLPARLRCPGVPAAMLVLADVMWRDRSAKTAGLRFEFFDNEERELWSGGLIDALLARHALG